MLLCLQLKNLTTNIRYATHFAIIYTNNTFSIKFGLRSALMPPNFYFERGKHPTILKVVVFEKMLILHKDIRGTKITGTTASNRNKN